MIVANFTAFAAACALTKHSAIFPTTITQKAQHDICTTDMSNTTTMSSCELPHQTSMFPRIVQKAAIITDQFEQNTHNFDINFRQLSVKNLKKLGISFSSVFDSCKSPGVIQTSSKHCYKQIILKYESGWIALQDVLSTGDFGSGFIGSCLQQAASCVRVRTPTLLHEESQKLVKPYAEESEQQQEQKIETKSLSASLKELMDVFTYKEGIIYDVFTAEDSSSLKTRKDNAYCIYGL